MKRHVWRDLGVCLIVCGTSSFAPGRSVSAAVLSANPTFGPSRIGQLRDHSKLRSPPMSGVNTKIPLGAAAIPGTQFGLVGSSGSHMTTPSSSAATGSGVGSGVTGDSAQPGVGACTAYGATNPNNGPVMTNPRVNLLFWGSWNATTANNITATWKQLTGIPALYSREAEYGIQQGSYGQRLPDYTGRPVREPARLRTCSREVCPPRCRKPTSYQRATTSLSFSCRRIPLRSWITIRGTSRITGRTGYAGMGTDPWVELHGWKLQLN